MRFLVDENLGPSLSLWLTSRGHDATMVQWDMRGMNDRDIIRKTYEEERVLITRNKDFGELAFHERRPRRGVILLRLEDDRLAMVIRALEKLLDEYADRIGGSFVVATENQTRFAGPAYI